MRRLVVCALAFLGGCLFVETAAPLLDGGDAPDIADPWPCGYAIDCITDLPALPACWEWACRDNLCVDVATPGCVP